MKRETVKWLREMALRFSNESARDALAPRARSKPRRDGA